MGSDKHWSNKPATDMGGFDCGIFMCLFLAGVASAGGWCGFVWVWGDLLVTGWAIGGGLVGPAFSLVCVRAIARHHRTRGAGAQEIPHPHSPMWAVMATLIGLLSVVGFVADRPATYSVLDPGGPGSCRVAVREYSYMFSGSGDVYAVGFGGLGRTVSSWTADDGLEPITTGNYSLQWEDDRALLSVYGESGSPVWPTSHQVAC